MSHPLHDLLTRDDHAVALQEDPLEGVVGHVVIEPAQEQVDGQPHTELALRQEAWWKGSDGDATASTATGILWPHGLANHQFGWHILQFLADLLTDANRILSTVFARLEPFGLNDHFPTFQMVWQRVTAATALLLGRVLVVGRSLRFVIEDVVAGGRLVLSLCLQIGGHVGQLALLLRGELLGGFAEKPALEFGQFEQHVLQLRFQAFLERDELRVLGRKSHPIGLQLSGVRFKPGRLGLQLGCLGFEPSGVGLQPDLGFLKGAVGGPQTLQFGLGVHAGSRVLRKSLCSGRT